MDDARARPSILDTWDAMVVERFDLLQSAGSAGRESCAFTISSQCLLSLDQTVNELGRRTRNCSIDPTASGAELVDLRSAAIEVVAGAYVDRLVSEGRQQGPAEDRVGRHDRAKSDDGNAREVIQRAAAQARGATVVCSLSPALVVGLDEAVGDVLGQNDLALDESVTLEAMRSMVVESALTAWLILRGSSSLAPSRQAPTSWLSSVASLARTRAGRWRRRPDE
jgi:hypothetical protein